jgi:hypothetical protein
MSNLTIERRDEMISDWKRELASRQNENTSLYHDYILIANSEAMKEAIAKAKLF